MGWSWWLEGVYLVMAWSPIPPPKARPTKKVRDIMGVIPPRNPLLSPRPKRPTSKIPKNHLTESTEALNILLDEVSEKIRPKFKTIKKVKPSWYHFIRKTEFEILSGTRYDWTHEVREIKEAHDIFVETNGQSATALYELMSEVSKISEDYSNQQKQFCDPDCDYGCPNCDISLFL